MQNAVLKRIHARHWAPGTLLPNEADIALEFGCARSTVNRALQSLADKGLLERRRRGGTRVVEHPERVATFKIPIIRLQIERSGCDYHYQLLSQNHLTQKQKIARGQGVQQMGDTLHIRALHSSDGNPYVLEDRWIDTRIVPAAKEADFSAISPNQWLVEQIPFSGGDLKLSAIKAKAADAKVLKCQAGDPLFRTERTTWNTERELITVVNLTYFHGYKMQVEL